MLEVVGNNLANLNTPGYKSQRIRFSDQFSALLESGSGPSANGGGKNPVEIGLGVQVAGIDTRFEQGTTEATGNKLDLAIQDNGFFLVRDGSDFLVTRAGAFSVDARNFLVDPSTGNRVQRVGTVGEGSPTAPAFQVPGNNDIMIRYGMTIPGKATQNITFRGNLDARADLPLATVLSADQPLTKQGQPATMDTRLNDLDQTIAGYAAGDRILIQGSRVDGSPVDAAFLATGTAADTVGALLAAINTAYLSATPGIGATAKINSDGRIQLTANQAGTSKLTLSLSSDQGDAQPGSGVTEFTNYTRIVEGRYGGSTTTVMEIFDRQFSAHNVSFTFRKEGNSTWSLIASLDEQEGTITRYGEDNAVWGLRFNENGSFAGIDGTATAQTLALKNGLTSGQTPATLATPLDQLDQHFQGAYSPADVLIISGSERDGRAVDPVTFAPFGKTVGDLINAINQTFLSATASLDASGNIVLTSNTTGQSELSLQIRDAATNTGMTMFGDFTEVVRGRDGDDNITFEITNPAGSGSKQTIQLWFGSQGGFDGLTQFGGFYSAASIEQDGFAQGTLVDVDVQANGIIIGRFSNGRSEPLAQLAIATFANPQGLERVGNNYFAPNAASGTPVITTAQAGGAGSIQSGVLESSNVDVGVEFTALIAAQRGFQVNARAFSIANQILEETANLLR
jgi:flagellar hook protein FlgE